MVSLCVSSALPNRLALRQNINNTKSYFCVAQNPRYQCKLSSALPSLSSSFCFNPLRISITRNDMNMMVKNEARRFGTICCAGPIAPRNLQWISVISSTVLMFARGTAIHKSFLVPLLALQAPSTVISWIKGDYGVWAAFLALLVRLFFFIPGELELPFMALIFVLVAPYQAMNLRGTQEGAIIALVIAGYLAFQHFSRIGNLQKAFEQGSVVATLAITCVTIISCLFLI